MLFVLFRLGEDRYALEASRVVEVVPLLEIKRLHRAPDGVAGIFNYRGRPVPAVDLAKLTLGRPALQHLSTRIIIVNYSDETGTNHLLGLIAEHATAMLRKDARDFVDPGMRTGNSPRLGPILLDNDGPIQWVHERALLPQTVSRLLFSELAAEGHETN
jgi:chemotaxis-related protein WspB